MPIWESSEEDWNWIFEINFRGVLHGIRTFAPTIIEQDEPGHVLNTASVAGNGICGVRKHAVVALTEALYQTPQAEGAKVGASALCPPFVTTRVFESERNRPGGDEVESLLNPDMLRDAIVPEEIAGFVLDAVRQRAVLSDPAPASTRASKGESQTSWHAGTGSRRSFNRAPVGRSERLRAGLARSRRDAAALRQHAGGR